VDAQGNITAHATTSCSNGVIHPDVHPVSTYEVNPDCTGWAYGPDGPGGMLDGRINTETGKRQHSDR
jgi:hypothetical protein